MIHDEESMEGIQSARQHRHHIRGLFHNWRTYIAIAIVAICIFTFTIVTGAFGGNSSVADSWLASEYGMANALESEQVAECNDIVVRLVYVIPSSSQTLVELQILDPTIGTEPSDGDSFTLRSDPDINLLGFRGNELLGPPQVKISQGKQKIILDLPALVDTHAEATIELKELTKRNSTTGTMTVVTGPWRLSFTPQVPDEQLFSRESIINEQLMIDGVQVLLHRVYVSATETLVFYQIQDTEDLDRSPLGQPTLEFADTVFRTTNKFDTDDSLVLGFPPLPDDVTQFAITLPRMMYLEGPGLSFSVNLGEYIKKLPVENGSITLDQVIDTGLGGIRFTELTITDNSFSLHYQPVDGNQKSGLLLVTGSRPASEIIEAIDDNGNHYPVLGTGSVFDRESFVVKDQDITFQGTLDPNSNQLSIKVNKTCTIGEPFYFHVEITE